MSNPSDQWFYGQDGTQRGPVDFVALQALARGGQLSPHDLVWCEGMPEWVAASTVPDLAFGSGDYASPALDVGGPIPLGYQRPMEGSYFAGFWWRFLAVFIDGLILLIPMVAIEVASNMIFFGVPFDNGRRRSPGDAIAQWLVSTFFTQALCATYYGLMESSRHQATLGKLACGLRVTDLQGGQLTLGRALGRYAASILSALIVYIGYIMVVWTERKQGLHDLIAGTLVVRRIPVTSVPYARPV